MSLDSLMPWELQSELHRAVRNGDVGCVLGVMKLLTKCGNIDALNKSGQTPLLVSVEKGHTEIAAVLVTSGADVNEGKPLEAAVLGNKPELVSLLCSSGAVATHPLTGYGISLLEFAIAKKYQKVTEILTYYSAEKAFELTSKSEQQVRSMISKRESNSFKQIQKTFAKESIAALEKSRLATQKRKINGMVVAACCDNVPELLIEAINEDPDGISITKDLIIKCVCGGSTDVLSELAQRFDIREALSETDEHGFNSMIYAVQNGDLPMLELIASLNPQLLQTLDSDGHSLLHWAAFSGCYQLAYDLVTRYSLSPYTVDSSGKTCLHWAVQSDADELSVLRVISFLTKRFPTLLSTKDMYRKTPLEVAQGTFASPCIKELVTPVIGSCDRRL